MISGNIEHSKIVKIAESLALPIEKLAPYSTEPLSCIKNVN